MKNTLFTTIAVLLLSAAAIAQVQGVGTVPGQVFAQQLNPAATTTSQAGTVTNPANNFIINISPGPIVCSSSGVTDWVNQSQMTLQASTTYLLVYNCFNGSMYVKTAVTGPGSGTGTSGTPGAPTSLLFADPNRGEISINTIVCGTTNCGNSSNGSLTDNRAAGSFPIVTDFEFDNPLGNCQEAASANAGASDGKVVLSGTLPNALAVLRGQITSTGNNVFTCSITLPTKITSGHGAVAIQDLTLDVSTQTTQPTSIAAVTFKSTTAPAPSASETASSATFTDLTGGGTTLLPTSAQFAALTVSGAGQLFSVKVTFTTNPVANVDLQKLSFSISFNQSAAAAQIVDLAGLHVHYAYIPN